MDPAPCDLCSQSINRSTADELKDFLRYIKGVEVKTIKTVTPTRPAPTKLAPTRVTPKRKIY